MAVDARTLQDLIEALKVRNTLDSQRSGHGESLSDRLFRYNGSRWVKIEDNVRTTLTPGSQNTTLRSGFVNNTENYVNNSGNVSVRQSLSQALRPKADN